MVVAVAVAVAVAGAVAVSGAVANPIHLQLIKFVPKYRKAANRTGNRKPNRNLRKPNRLRFTKKPEKPEPKKPKPRFAKSGTFAPSGSGSN